MRSHSKRELSVEGQLSPHVIPGRPKDEPGIHAHRQILLGEMVVGTPHVVTDSRGYGFRARADARPGMTWGEGCDLSRSSSVNYTSRCSSRAARASGRPVVGFAAGLRKVPAVALRIFSASSASACFTAAIT